jgi:septum site-determining protein MinD
LAKIISTHSFRGGTGKSNTTANLAVMLARSGRRVAVIDTDIQSPGIHVLFGLNEKTVTRSLNDYLWGECRIQDAAYDVRRAALANGERVDIIPALYLIPSSLKSGEIARILREGYDVGLLNDGIQRLIGELTLDYLFIDTHPGVNEETLLSIAISDSLVLIMRPDNQDFQGTAVTVELARRLEVPDMCLVVNKVPASLDPAALRRQVESTFKAEVAGVLPLNSEIVELASRGIFTIQFPHHPFTDELKKVAQRLAR